MTVVVVGTALLSVGAVRADDVKGEVTGSAADETKAARAWFDGLIAECAAEQDPRVKVPLLLEWNELDVYVPAKEDIERLRREVAGHPQHPDRQKLAHFERINAGKLKPQRFRVWVFDSQYRVNSDYLSYPRSASTSDDMTLDGAEEPERTYWDRAYDGTLAWSLAPGAAHIVDPKNLQGGADYSSDKWIFQRLPRLFTTGGLAYVFEPTFKTTAFSLSMGKWQARRTLVKDGVSLGEVVCKGIWDHDHARGEVHECWFADERGERGSYYVSRGWAHDPTIGWHATSVRREWDSRSAKELTFVSAAPVSVTAFQELIALPSDSRPDGIRGELKIGYIRNYATKEGSVARQSSAATGEKQWVSTTMPSRSSSPWIRVGGWALAGIIVAVTLVMLRARRVS